jgi:invasion protein IalB
MGLYAQQAANLSGWSGDYSQDEWRKFRREFEAKLTPLWVRRQIDEIEAELVGERARREGAERRDRVLQAQIAKEAEAQQDLKEERDKVLDEAAALKTTVEELTQARAEAQQALTRDRNKAVAEVAALKTSVEELTKARTDAEARAVELSQRLTKVRQSKTQEIVRSVGTALSPFVIVAAVATAGFWTYQLIWSAPQPSPAITSDSTADAQTKLKAAEIEQQRLQEEVQGQAKAATELQTKLQAVQAEQQQQARAVAEADSKRKAAEAEQQRLKEEVQRQTKAAADTDTKLKAALTEQQRLAKAAADAEEKRRAAEAEQQRLAAAKAEEERNAKAAADAEAQRKAAEVEQQRLAGAKAEEERKLVAVAKAEAQRKAEGAERQQLASGVAPWRLECSTEGKPVADELRLSDHVQATRSDCRAVQQLFHGETRQLVAQATVRQNGMVITIPLGVNLTAPVLVKIDNGTAERQPVKTCTNVGCFVAMTLTDKFIAAMRTGSNLKITVMDANNKPIEMSLPLLGFGSAFDTLR